MTKNQIEYQKHLENVRANKAREQETHRSNVKSEQIAAFTAKSNDYWRGREYDTTTRYQLGSLAETTRSNKAREAETYRSNVTKETETARHNRATEQADMMRAQAAQTQASAAVMQVDLGYAQLAETQRSNMARESAILQSQAEVARSNRAQEQLIAERQAEQRRVNTAQISVDQSRVAESERHNRVTEGQQYIALGTQQQQAESAAKQAEASMIQADAAQRRAASSAFRDYTQGVTQMVDTAYGIAGGIATSVILGG